MRVLPLSLIAPIEILARIDQASSRSGRQLRRRRVTEPYPNYLPSRWLRRDSYRQGPGKVMKLGRGLRCHNCRGVPGVSEGGGRARANDGSSHTHRRLPRGNARPLMPSSSLTAAARSQYLLDLLARLPDPRKRRGRRYSLAGLLAVGIAAVTAGSRSFAAIGQWAADAGTGVLAGLGAVRGPDLPRGGSRWPRRSAIWWAVAGSIPVTAVSEATRGSCLDAGDPAWHRRGGATRPDHHGRPVAWLALWRRSDVGRVTVVRSPQKRTGCLALRAGR